MKKKVLLYICSAIIIVSNVLMATIMNHGESIFSNIFLIGITVILLPGFLWTINTGQTSQIKPESFALMMIAVLSVVRLINRIHGLPEVFNYVILGIVIVLGVFLLIVAAVRTYRKKKDRQG